MADKKCTIYIVDVGPTMWQVKRDEGGIALDLARKALLAMLEAKVFNNNEHYYCYLNKMLNGRV